MASLSVIPATTPLPRLVSYMFLVSAYTIKFNKFIKNGKMRQLNKFILQAITIDRQP
ncbi:hypothetical protein D3C77_361710 [compost metagenome]